MKSDRDPMRRFSIQVPNVKNGFGHKHKGARRFIWAVMCRKMKTYILIILMVLLINCSAYQAEIKKDILRKDDSIGKITHDEITYYIVEVADLKRARKGLTYVGSIENYHLLREWLKVACAHDEISFFAIRKEDCIVENERAPKDEYNINASRGHRAVNLGDGKCLVK